MIVTKEKMTERWLELNQPQIDRLKEQAKNGSQSAIIKLQSYYGYSCDYLPQDNGEPPYGYEEN